MNQNNPLKNESIDTQ